VPLRTAVEAAGPAGDPVADAYGVAELDALYPYGLVVVEAGYALLVAEAAYGLPAVEAGYGLLVLGAAYGLGVAGAV
jgi:hypothetical protein